MYVHIHAYRLYTHTMYACMCVCMSVRIYMCRYVYMQTCRHANINYV